MGVKKRVVTMMLPVRRTENFDLRPVYAAVEVALEI